MCGVDNVEPWLVLHFSYLFLFQSGSFYLWKLITLLLEIYLSHVGYFSLAGFLKNPYMVHFALYLHIFWKDNNYLFFLLWKMTPYEL